MSAEEAGGSAVESFADVFLSPSRALFGLRALRPFDEVRLSVSVEVSIPVLIDERFVGTWQTGNGQFNACGSI